MHPLRADHQIAVLPSSPLARGKLARVWKPETRGADTEDVATRLYGESENDREIVDRVERLAADRGVSMAQTRPIPQRATHPS